jgi:hypothetical protein
MRTYGTMTPKLTSTLIALTLLFSFSAIAGETNKMSTAENNEESSKIETVVDNSEKPGATDELRAENIREGKKEDIQESASANLGD